MFPLIYTNLLKTGGVSMWSIIIITAVLTAGIIIPISLRKAKTSVKSASTPLHHKPEDILKGIGMEISATLNKGSYLTVYQGGNFICHFKEGTNCMDIIYPGFEYFSFEHIQKALMTANNINYKYAIWACYIEKANEEHGKGQFKASLSARWRVQENLPQFQEQIREALGSAFRIARSFSSLLVKEISESRESERTLFNDTLFHAKLNQIQWANSIRQYKEESNTPPISSALSLSYLLTIYKEADFGCLQNLTLIHNETIERWTDIETITHFDVREYIRKQPDPSSIHHLTLQLSFEKQELLIALSKIQGSTPHTLLFNVNILRSGNDIQARSSKRLPTYSQTVMEIRLSEPDKDHWEAQYLIADAEDKIKSGQINELNDEQLLILAHTNPSIRLSLYWGKKYYNHHCHIQSLYHFGQIYHSLKGQCRDWKKKDRELYYEICYYIGSIYMELNKMEQAFYYLFIAQSQRFDAAIALMDCLCYMEDPSAKSYIHSTLEQTVRQMQESEEEAEKLSDLYHLLKRRYAHVLVNRREWEEARLFLTKMIENGEDIEFAKNELEHIRKNRQNDEPSL